MLGSRRHYEHLAAVFTLASERVATPARPQARGARCRVDMNKESMNPPRRRIEEGQEDGGSGHGHGVRVDAEEGGTCPRGRRPERFEIFGSGSASGLAGWPPREG